MYRVTNSQPWWQSILELTYCRGLLQPHRNKAKGEGEHVLYNIHTKSFLRMIISPIIFSFHYVTSFVLNKKKLHLKIQLVFRLIYCHHGTRHRVTGCHGVSSSTIDITTALNQLADNIATASKEQQTHLHSLLWTQPASKKYREQDKTGLLRQCLITWKFDCGQDIAMYRFGKRERRTGG